MIDSGATYSVAPASSLKRLHIKPIDKQKFLLANGEEVIYDIGEARFTLMGKQRVAPIIFGAKGAWVIGATTLETMGFILDPINRKLLSLPLTI